LLGEAPGDVTAYPESEVEEDALLDAYRRILVPISFQAHGGEVFHASAVSCPGGVIAFSADSQGGKSTMAYAMSLRGHAVWADDAVAVDFDEGVISAVRLPFILRLRASAAQFFLGSGREADDDLAAARRAKVLPEERAPVAAIFILERLDAGAESASAEEGAETGTE